MYLLCTIIYYTVYVPTYSIQLKYDFFDWLPIICSSCSTGGKSSYFTCFEIKIVWSYELYSLVTITKSWFFWKDKYKFNVETFYLKKNYFGSTNKFNIIYWWCK